MLAEFALTPAIFDEEAHEDKDMWLDELRELGATMFPRLSASPIMISNLYEGSWHPETEKVVMAIKDHRARQLCQQLLTKVGGSLVFRPARNDWPVDECAWAREAIESASEEPIERVIASRMGYETLVGEGHSVRCISEVHDAGFWTGIAADGTVPMRIAEQVALLRKLCIHSEFLCVLTPHVYGGADDETDLVKEVIRSALGRPAGYRPVSIDIHTEGPRGNPNDADFAEKLRKCTSNICQTLHQVLANGQSVNLLLWPKLLHRYVIGGVFTETTGGIRARSPRWGISLQHFARGRDDPSQAPSPWNLLTRDSLLDCFNRYFADGVPGCLAGYPVQITPNS